MVVTELSELIELMAKGIWLPGTRISESSVLNVMYDVIYMTYDVHNVCI